MTAKRFYLWLAIATGIGAILGTLCTIAYRYGCDVQKVQKVTTATAELYVDVKEIKSDVNDLKEKQAAYYEKVANIERGVNRLESTMEKFFVVRPLAEMSTDRRNLQ